MIDDDRPGLFRSWAGVALALAVGAVIWTLIGAAACTACRHAPW